MNQTTPVELVETYNAPMALSAAVTYLRRRGVPVSRATLYRWNTDAVAAGGAPLLHQPSGGRGRVYVVPAEIEAHIRNRWSDNRAGQTA